VSKQADAEPTRSARPHRERLADDQRLRRFLRRLPFRLASRVVMRLDLAGWRRLDGTQWRSLRPGDDELLQTRLVWVAEAYAPSDVPALLDGLEGLGFDKGQWTGESVARSVVERRRKAEGWAQYALPLICRPGDRVGFGNQIERELPDGVRAAWPGLTVLPGSVTVLVFTFLLQPDSAMEIDRTVRRNFATQVNRRTERGWSFHGPRMEQRKAVRAAMAAQRTELEGWVARHLPGAFARRGHYGHPGARLLTYRTEAAVRFDLQHAWSLTIDSPSAFEIWRANRWPALGVSFGDSVSCSEGMLHLMAHERALVPRQEEGEGDGPLDEDERWWLLFQQLHRSLEETLVLHTLHELLGLFTARLADIRDLAAPRTLRPSPAARQLTRVRDALEVATDARSVAADLAQERHAIHGLSYDGGDWTPPKERALEPLLRTLRASLPERAAAVLAAELRVRDRLGIETQLFSAGAGLRLQRGAFWIALVALFASVAAVAVALIQVLCAAAS
jgi:hypothetical protein